MGIIGLNITKMSKNAISQKLLVLNSLTIMTNAINETKTRRNV
jgi:hypothetical protein